MADIVVKVCDRHPDERVPAEAVTVTLDGREYTLDVCAVHREELETLRRMLEEYVAVGRQVSGEGPPRRQRGPRSDSPQAEENRKIRTWAREQGRDVPERGRIPDKLRADYWAATRERAGMGPPALGQAFPDAQLRREAEASVALDRDQTHEVGPVAVGITAEQAATPPPQPDLEPAAGDDAVARDRVPVRGPGGVVRWTSG